MSKTGVSVYNLVITDSIVLYLYNYTVSHKTLIPAPWNSGSTKTIGSPPLHWKADANSLGKIHRLRYSDEDFGL